MWKKVSYILKVKDLSFYVISIVFVFNEAHKNDENFSELKIIQRSQDESNYKDIEDLESAYEMKNEI